MKINVTKIIQYLVILLFALIILIPLATFNSEEGAISEIDNRALAKNPFKATEEEKAAEGYDLTESIESYVSDRIGMRDDMVLAYTVLNDRLFGKMVHPLYSYGTDGYVFAAGLTSSKNKYTEFHTLFANMVKDIQDYCDARGVPFVFVFDPAKPAVCTEYIPKGINYDRSWVDQFLAALDERGVRYVDVTETLREKFEAGEMVFNKKYDANHWNDLGAYYGTAAVFEELQKDFPEIQIYSPDQLSDDTVTQTSLLVSKFPINEETPNLIPYPEVDNDMMTAFSGLERHKSHRTFGYYTNEEQIEKGAPKALVFQGSYWNGLGRKYAEHAFGEYIHVHDYQNVINFDYFFNVFKPDVVIFEVAEYTMFYDYFSYTGMRNINYNPTLDSVKSTAETTQQATLDPTAITATESAALTKITWKTDTQADYAWLCMNGVEYDLKKVDGGYTLTLLTDDYKQHKDGITLYTVKEKAVTSYTAAPAE